MTSRSCSSKVEIGSTYGVHYFEVKDKAGIPWWLGLSYKGIAQYDHADKKTPRRVFPWRQLENLYFRDRKFTIEVHNPKRVVHALSSFNLYEDAIDEPLDECDELSDAITDPTTQVSVSRRTFEPGNVTVHVWLTPSPHLAKCIWSMAISQHQFYLDRKQNKHLTSSCTVNDETAGEVKAFPKETNKAGTNSTASEGSLEEIGNNVVRAAKMEIISALKARKLALKAKLQEKTEELKLLCVKEAELTGELPPELPLEPGEPLPQFRKRIGTAFSLPEKLLNKLKSNEVRKEEVLAKLELEFEIQTRITSAALRLANDISSKKSVRKQRKVTYQQALTKLKDIESRLIAVRRAVAQKKLRNQVKKKQPRPSSDGEDHNDDNHSHSTEENELTLSKSSPSLSLKEKSSPCLEDLNERRTEVQHVSYRKELTAPLADRSVVAPSPTNSSASSSSLPRPQLPPPVPSSPVKQRRSSGSSRTSSPSSNRLTVGGYIPSPIYQTKSAYRSQQYPTFSTRSQSSSSYSTSNHSDYDNVAFSSVGKLNPAFCTKYDALSTTEARGMYNVPRQRTSQVFPSQEELNTHHLHPQSTPHHSYHHPRVGRHPSGGQNRYGSLDRTLYNSSHTSSGSSTSGSTHNQPVKLESRSLDNLDYNTQQDSRSSPNTTSGSRDTFDTFASSQDYLECPISPHFVDKNMLYSYESILEDAYKPYTFNEPQINPSPRAAANTNEYKTTTTTTNRPSYLNYANSEWYSTVHGEHPRAGPSPSYPQLPQNPSPTMYQGHDAQKNPLVDSIPRAKPKEWYETSLDSPLPCRKTASASVVDGKPPKVPQHSSPAPSSHHPTDRYTPTKSMLDMEHLSSSSSSSFVHVPYETPQNHVMVSMGQFQPYREVTKPYELADYYKYSTKVRKRSQSSIKSDVDVAVSSSGNTLGNVTRSTPALAHQIDVNAGSTTSGSRPNSPFSTPISPIVPRSPYAKPRNRDYDPSSSIRNQLMNLNVRSPSPFSPGGPIQQSISAEMMFQSPPQQIQSKHPQQRPPTSEPLKGSSVPSTPTSPKNASLSKSLEGSFSFQSGPSLADAFHEEMLAWYEGQEVKQATLV